MTSNRRATGHYRSFRIAAALVLLMCSQASLAQGAYEKCKEVLMGDLFNRVSDMKTSTSDEKAAVYSAFASETSDEAYKQYKEASKGKIDQGQAIKANFDYMAVSAGVDLKFDYSRDDSHSKFDDAWRKIQAKYSSTSSSSSESASNLVSQYASSIRDPNTIKAWEHCVTSSQETGIYAYGKRDAEGNPSVKVIWVPGNFGGLASAVSVSFVKPNGAAIEGESPNLKIAQGTGHEFAIHYDGHSAGFDVGINGTVLNAQNEPAVSFTSNARIPPLRTSPGPAGVASGCFDRLAPNRKYEVGVVQGVDHWIRGQLVISGLSDCPGSTVSKCFEGRLSLQELSLQGVMDLAQVRADQKLSDLIRNHWHIKPDPNGQKTLGPATAERVTGRFASTSFALLRRSNGMENWVGNCTAKGDILGKVQVRPDTGPNGPGGAFTINLGSN